MYQIKCDGYQLYDPRDEELIVSEPKISLEVNTVGEGSFTIHANHPFYDKLKKLKSVFEVSDEIGVIFRGRMTNDSYDFQNSKYVDLEGAMAYFNDSRVRPYAFPDDWLEDPEYIAAAESGNVVEFFLKWIISQHNAQVSEFQHFKLGNVTVKDNTGNNYITRSDTKYPSTWEVLKSKLFESSLGGYLCIRYEADGNYIDYLKEFDLTNTQEIVFGENLLDLVSDSDANETYSAVLPLGATVKNDDGEEYQLTIKTVGNGAVNSDIVKSNDMIYSRSAVSAYGLVFAPISETTWDDVTDAATLCKKAVDYLADKRTLFSETVEVAAVDLHFTDAQIQSFRIYRNVKVRSSFHGLNGVYPLSKLAIDLQNPQNTEITVGNTRRTLTDLNATQKNEANQQLDSFRGEIQEVVSKTENLEHKIEGIDGTFFYIKYSQYADGRNMTNAPTAFTEYMGTCSTSEETAPTDPTEYTWCKIKGDSGASPIICCIESSAGYTLNNDAEITLTAKIFDGATEIDPEGKRYYRWYRSVDGGEFMVFGAGKTVTVSENDYSDIMDVYFTSDDYLDERAIVGIAMAGIAICGKENK